MKEPWRSYALCGQVDPELWFPFNNRKSQADRAKRICGDCPVQNECLSEALRNGDEYGIWGGCTAMERRRLSRSMAATHLRKPPDSVQPCGTKAAYARHHRNQETPCKLCREAHNLYELRRRSRGLPK